MVAVSMARVSAENRLPITDGARKLFRWGRNLYWTGVILAVSILSMAVIFAFLDSEPIFQRATSVVVLGVIPALMVWGSGLVIFIILRAASSVCDWTTAALQCARTGINGRPTRSATPLPAALPFFAGGLGLMGFLGRRRKRKAAIAAA
jgi:hypothetical protein